MTTKTSISFCMDCWQGYIGSHDCVNPRPTEFELLEYYYKRREYLARQSDDRWGDNAANSPEEAFA